ncbi:LOG family protein [Enterovibrio norvegicus FF-33]|uniref:Pyrimidine/purine nucleotide 5'-monophosphate nucleosidase n=1 Tax=Enterovibrio norvegicus FF-454 TaxID=1185651 RepID=A0A1E5CA76_9GAMM|nr:nucleotide 5'-monophosphate nucleosidase PpnN [Enterovibrio norvegicus]OEE62421.1 LOG family protein [Enterovibrio norvegicus FF-454]OEE68311.1 LOG family protein [Enterovibrio norvegicus FF-33]OEE75094.1 LOG family protein [Enterovibrio norvegicus FF-162]
MITHISPVGAMDLLSQLEVDRLKDTAKSDLYRLYRNCSLAVLNSGSHTDSSKELLEQYKTFDIRVMRRERGVKLELVNPPDHAFVDGKIIRGIQEHMFSVLRDIIHVNVQLEHAKIFNLTNSNHITNLIFDILRNAKAMVPGRDPNLVVCWGGHSINPIEYQYTREVGHELGLRELNICTGCGPGAMEGPMKGAAIGHAKQRVTGSRFLGLTEPSIIAAEPPNPIVNELVIMPDIEKRLEAFVRVGHAIVIFPGGAGTAEELLYLLGILMHPDNVDQPMPVVLTGPKESESYFRVIDEFVRDVIGEEATKYYQIVVGDPAKAARIIKQGMPAVKEHRKSTGDAYSFNWSLKIAPEFQLPFEPNHENMANLDLHMNQRPELLASALRQAFSGIVAGNVKEEGIREIERNGPFKINGDAVLMKKMDKLLRGFVEQQRMKLPGTAYVPCYEIVQGKGNG